MLIPIFTFLAASWSSTQRGHYCGKNADRVNPGLNRPDLACFLSWIKIIQFNWKTTTLQISSCNYDLWYLISHKHVLTYARMFSQIGYHRFFAKMKISDILRGFTTVFIGLSWYQKLCHCSHLFIGPWEQWWDMVMKSIDMPISGCRWNRKMGSGTVNGIGRADIWWPFFSLRHTELLQEQHPFRSSSFDTKSWRHIFKK